MNQKKDEYTHTKIRTVVRPRTFLFHFFQCCSELHFLPAPPEVANRCGNPAELQVTALVCDSLIVMGKNNAGVYHGDACL